MENPAFRSSLDSMREKKLSSTDWTSALFDRGQYAVNQTSEYIYMVTDILEVGVLLLVWTVAYCIYF